jgi:hypothetical protein
VEYLGCGVPMVIRTVVAVPVVNAMENTVLQVLPADEKERLI